VVGREELTWMKHFLSLGVTGTERAVQLEVVDVVEKRTADGEQNVLKKLLSINELKSKTFYCNNEKTFLRSK
jgi:hypothetical protein